MNFKLTNEDLTPNKNTTQPGKDTRPAQKPSTLGKRKTRSYDAARLSTEAIRVIAQSMPSINAVSDAAAAVLAPDAEYRLREIIQDSVKFMKHSKRSRLIPDDINAALRLRNVAPLYGFGKPAAAQPPPSTSNGIAGEDHSSGVEKPRVPRFSSVEGTSDLFFMVDEEVNLKSLAEAELPPRPLEVTVAAHWLAVNGVQPAIPENPLPAEVSKQLDSTKATKQVNGVAQFGHANGLANNAEVKPVLKHVLSKELQLYYDHVIGALSGSDSSHRDACLSSISEEPGLVQLLPYFTLYIHETVNKSLRNLPLLFSLMRLVRALLTNRIFKLENYLHQLLPSIITCLVGKRLFMKPRQNHWALRDYSARIIKDICIRYRQSYPTLQPRITKTLQDALLDPKRPLTTHYGAIVGLASLGKHVVDLLVVPHIQKYVQLVRNVLDDPSTKPKGIRRLEASKVLASFGFASCVNCQSLKPSGTGGIDDMAFLPEETNLTVLAPDSLESLVPGAGAKLREVVNEYDEHIYPFQSKKADNEIAMSLESGAP